MKHNFCLPTLFLTFFMLISANPAFAKVIQSEFLNRAGYGSEGPQLHEIDYSGTKTYLLTYQDVGDSTLFKNLTKKEYLRIQAELHDLLAASASETNEPCDKELVYTRVQNEDKVSHANICWERLAKTHREKISQWMLGLRKSFQ